MIKTHILITRFNVKTFGLKKPTEAWTLDRINLFEHFCFPSVESQVEQRFRWLVFIDVDTEKSILRRLSTLQERREFLLVRVSQFDKKVVVEHVRKHIVGTGTLVTSRLDNDDAIACEFMGHVRCAVQEQQPHWINFDDGLKFDGQNVYRSCMPSNPFLSLAERVEDFRTVMCMPHDLVISRERVVCPLKGPLWLQLIHAKNLSNRVRQSDRCVGLEEVALSLQGFCPAVIRYILKC